ncbi:hypothetical protein ACJIZ3_004339 [Penstemon smallii]|uniref:Brf1 TBP-binding domain-containing protein n=1 Tax=Penstemon smallii TaxID=265156 RepID=A0ABD3S1R5_9LAMI
MDVNQNSDSNLKPLVEDGVESSCREEIDAGPCGLTQTSDNPSRCSTKGPSTRHRDIKNGNCGMAKRSKTKRSTKENESDSLSDIDDAEIIGYLNNKKEMQFKSLLWEAINRNYMNAKKQKRTIETKKGGSVKKTAKTAEKVDTQKRSSRINYDALKMLDDELEQGTESAEITTKADSNNHRTDVSPNKSMTPEMHGEYGDEQFNYEDFDF